MGNCGNLIGLSHRSGGVKSQKELKKLLTKGKASCTIAMFRRSGVYLVN